MLGKYVWWIEQKADHLWVKWVHAVYIKGKVWKDYEPTVNSSWDWRKICQVRTVLRQVLYGGNGSGGNYSTLQGYKFLVPEGEQVPWYPWIRIGWIIPRHRFLVWVVAQQRLLTQDRLMKMGIVQTNVCLFCGVEEESHEHLFFRCVYSERCRALIATWCCIDIPMTSCVDWWLKWRVRDICRKRIVAMILASLMQHVWWSRNVCRVEQYIHSPKLVASLVRNEIRMRIRSCRIVSIKSSVKHWIEKLCNEVG
ncbi:uncharacterized protein LOC141630765 [Silene latifolia]|uniref:uncharacterized protein LOC141630765 n=1 Tax=Silene latifolia TaxID=37657 RepID=UPI003D77F6FB